MLRLVNTSTLKEIMVSLSEAMPKREKLMWYAFFVTTGKENIISTYLDKILVTHDYISYELLVPRRELKEYKSGIVITKLKPLFPGYILIKTNTILLIYQILRNWWHRDMRAILRSNENFHEIKWEEIKIIKQLVNDEGIIKVSDIFLENNRVLITKGPLVNYTGIIKKVNRRKKRAKIILNFLNNKHDVDVSINCLEKINTTEIKNKINFNV